MIDKKIPAAGRTRFKPTNIKGGYDCPPEVQTMRNKITDVLRRNFEAYGYLPLETAQINYLDLLTYKYDPNAEIVHEIYKIKDQGDRDLGLRFDLTVPFCKFIAMNQNLKMPFKRYEIGKVWRNGPVKSGRAREFYQCDIDVVGISGPHIEAELILLAVTAYLELGIEPIVRYGNRKLLPADDALLAKIDKLSKGDAMRELEKIGINKNSVPEIVELEKCLEELGVLKYCEFAPYIVRGLNVYTGTVYEIFDKAERIPSALGGGGRYDNIIGNFIGNGLQYPAVGISFGLEPIAAVLGAQANQTSLVDLMLIPLGTESFAQKKADQLRAEGKRVLVYLGAKNLAKAFEYAAAYGIKHCAVVGPDEVAGKELVIKVVK